MASIELILAMIFIGIGALGLFAVAVTPGMPHRSLMAIGLLCVVAYGCMHLFTY